MKANTNKRLTLPKSVLEAVLCQSKVSETPHNFYKYPARFAPTFAREVIRAFSRKNQVVLDPFCGGGTTLLEAMSMGRRSAGMDVSTLATFIARAKTTPLSVHDRRAIEKWCNKIAVELPTGGTDCGRFSEEDREHYERNLPDDVMGFFAWVIAKIGQLKKSRQQAFARLILLSVGQWALDNKANFPKPTELRDELVARLREALANYMTFLDDTAEVNGVPASRLSNLRRVINRDSREMSQDGRIPDSWLPAKLVVTSPPYPGVHVVYHRWQINGRKETPAPFWLANQRDGQGESYYALGRRDEPELETYYERLEQVFSSVHTMLGKNALVFQLVAFSKPEWQLPAFLKAMKAAGFKEVLVKKNHPCIVGGRAWRQVPGRKWYANKRGNIPASKEVLLIHKAVKR